MDKLEYQDLRDIVKEGGEDIIEKFEKKFKQMKVEGNRKEEEGCEIDIVYFWVLYIFANLIYRFPARQLSQGYSD